MFKDALFFFVTITLSLFAVSFAELYKVGPVITAFIVFFLTLVIGHVVYRK